MKRIIIVILALIFIPLATNAAEVTFERVTTYVNGVPIAAAKLPLIVYTVWTAPTATGPFTAGPTSTDNLIVAPDPAAGSTAWYSVSARLDGVDSARCVPASKTVAPLTPSSPPGCLVR